MGGCNFKKIPPINVPNINGAKFQVFLARNVQKQRQPTI